MCRTAARVSSSNSAVSDGIGNRDIVSLLGQSSGAATGNSWPHTATDIADIVAEHVGASTTPFVAKAVADDPVRP
jgi:hypothetical protein